MMLLPDNGFSIISSLKAAGPDGGGVRSPLKFASDERIRQHEELAGDRILGLRYEECLVSDQSILWDFHEEESNDLLNQKVLAIYGVDISDLESALIADILERLPRTLRRCLTRRCRRRAAGRLKPSENGVETCMLMPAPSAASRPNYFIAITCSTN